MRRLGQLAEEAVRRWRMAEPHPAVELYPCAPFLDPDVMVIGMMSGPPGGSPETVRAVRERFAAEGIERVHITCLCRQAGRRPTAADIEAVLRLLRAEMGIVAPRVLVPLSPFATRLVTYYLRPRIPVFPVHAPHLHGKDEEFHADVQKLKTFLELIVT